jgi:alpha-N-arabinofuranosidase
VEEIDTMEDALAFGGAWISLLNHADRVRTACLAQLVNAIAPIMTKTGGGAWRQTTFFPFAHMSRFGRGRVLRTRVESDTYDTNYYDPRGSQELTFPVLKVPYLKIAAVAGASDGLSLFMLNRDLKQEMEVTLEARSFGQLAVIQAFELRHDDLQATNTRDAPGRVAPQPLDDVTIVGTRLQARLKPASWNVVRLSAT